VLKLLGNFHRKIILLEGRIQKISRNIQNYVLNFLKEHNYLLIIICHGCDELVVCVRYCRPQIVLCLGFVFHFSFFFNLFVFVANIIKLYIESKDFKLYHICIEPLCMKGRQIIV